MHKRVENFDEKVQKISEIAQKQKNNVETSEKNLDTFLENVQAYVEHKKGRLKETSQELSSKTEELLKVSRDFKDEMIRVTGIVEMDALHAREATEKAFAQFEKHESISHLKFVRSEVEVHDFESNIKNLVTVNETSIDHMLTSDTSKSLVRRPDP